MMRALAHRASSLRSPRDVGRALRARQADRAAAADLFDRAYYRAANPDVAASGMDEWRHYVRVGASELRAPNALFDPAWYLARYPDVGESGLDPVTHFLRYGAAEGRDPHPLFSTSWYLAAYPHVRGSGLNPLLHFLRHGSAQLLDPHPLFDTRWYLSEYPDVRESGANALVDYVVRGAAQGRNPSPYFYGDWYLRQYPDAAASGLNPLTHYVEVGERAGYQTNPQGRVPRRLADVAMGAARLKAAGREDDRSVRFLTDSRWPALEPIRVFRDEGPGRITVVTDSVGSDSLFGGVATALILASLWAAAEGRELRIVTRTTAPDPSGFATLRALYDLPVTGNPQFRQHPPGARTPLDVRPDDVFLTTSWWTTAATLPSVDPGRVCYLLQEDERMFYPSGDDAVRAGLVMSDPRPFVVVNSHRLYEHLTATGCTNLRDRGVSFEPSFQVFCDIRHRESSPGHRELFFYSRPNNARNLFYLGIGVIDEALARGILDPAAWTLNLVGPGTPELDLTGRPRVRYHPALDWQEYATLIGGMDLGLSLMATPHTSYPPLDLLAAGAVVVTNAWPGKTGLDAYGSRLIVGEPNREGLLDALERAVEAIDRGPARDVAPALRIPWSDALGGVIARLVEEFPRV